MSSSIAPTHKGRTRMAALLRADFIAMTHTALVLILNFVVPVFIVVLYSRRQTTGEIANAIAGGAFAIGLALTIGLMTSSLFGYSITLARDREAGVFQRLRLTPTPTWQIMGSRLVLQVVADLVMTVIVIIVASILHQASFGVGQYLVLLGVSLLGSLMFLALAQALVALVNSVAVVSAVSWSSVSTVGVVSGVIYIVIGTYVGVRWFRWGTN